MGAVSPGLLLPLLLLVLLLVAFGVWKLVKFLWAVFG